MARACYASESIVIWLLLEVSDQIPQKLWLSILQINNNSKRTTKATHGSDLSSTKRACLKSLNFSWKSTCSVTSWFFSISNPLCGCTAAMFLVLLVSGIKTSKNIGKIKSTLMDEVEDTHAVPHVIPTSANISIASNRNLLPCSALG